ncbi:MAG: hypothetical protein Q8N14_04040 [Candidatus Omnitrophota bacterium]|nr:hypothetical protein [Candidatus Omnitrophota bacterium]
MENKKIIGLIGLFVFGIILISDPAVYGSSEEALEIILPSGVAQLYAPLEIEDTQYYRDGGTIGVVLKDRDGKFFSFCLDGRMQVANFGEAAKPYHIYVGATHPESPGAQSVSIGGREEKSLLKALQAWADEQLSAKEKERILNVQSPDGITEKEIKAYRVLEIIEVLKNR